MAVKVVRLVSTLDWRPLGEDDLVALAELATACLDIDGGLPLLAEEETLRRHYLSGVSIGGWDETGDLVAAASIFADGEGRVATGLTHPEVRSQHYGVDLVRWAREHAGGARLKVLAESTWPDQGELFADAGLIRVFAEHVMRHRRKQVPRIPLPDGLHTEPFREDTAAAFYSAYAASFADRPGFPGTPQEEWLAELTQDPEVLLDDSRVALTDEGEPVGFITLSQGWIDQVGVIPSWRGHGLGAHLVVRSITALRAHGERPVWLCVNVDNPHAHELYVRLGFKDHGMRARYLETEEPG
jgi:ribosomal protein S18 acetylase RimI-like enzyme